MFGATIKPTATDSCQTIVDQVKILGDLTGTLKETLGLSANPLLSNLNILGAGGLGTGGSNGGSKLEKPNKEQTKPKGGGLFGGLLRH